MILLREARVEDIPALEQLANIPGFINLPNDPDQLKAKIQKSLQSFKDAMSGTGQSDPFSAKYMFAAEDVETKRVLGTSMLAAQHGTPESPHFFFEVGNEKKFSDTINTGFIHGTLKFKYDSDGPSEIGGLVVDSEIRNSDDRVGRQISFVRFLFVATHRARFKKKMIAELLPPLNKKGQSPLWEAVGRRFTNMDYWEADQLCNKNKEFVFSLFPTGKIYTTFLPAEARNAIGKVGKQTEPVFHMLGKIGFKYHNQVDPFDGGPHLWATVDDLLPVKKTKTYKFQNQGETASHEIAEEGILTKTAGASANEGLPGLFRAVHVRCTIAGSSIQIEDRDKERRVSALLGIKPGDAVTFMPYY